MRFGGLLKQKQMFCIRQFDILIFTIAFQTESYNNNTAKPGDNAAPFSKDIQRIGQKIFELITTNDPCVIFQFQKSIKFLNEQLVITLSKYFSTTKVSQSHFCYSKVVHIQAQGQKI